MFCYNFHILESLASGEITHHLTSYEHFGNAKKFNRFFLDDLETLFSSVLQPGSVAPRAKVRGLVVEHVGPF